MLKRLCLWRVVLRRRARRERTGAERRVDRSARRRSERREERRARKRAQGDVRASFNRRGLAR